MNRRSFFGLLSAGLASLALPTKADALVDYEAENVFGAALDEESYVCLTHPSAAWMLSGEVGQYEGIRFVQPMREGVVPPPWPRLR